MKIVNKVRHPTLTKEAICGFFEQYRFLSNFHPCNILFDDIMYPSVEHAYVAAKTNDIKIREEISKVKNPVHVKSYGRKLELRQDWDMLKPLYMMDFVTEKFRTPGLQKQLIETGYKYLEETNNWGDVYWGYDMDQKKGLNLLGKTLMIVRERYR